MKVKVRIHADPLAVELTKQFFDYDPYNGMFESEMIEQLDKQLKSIDGCKEIISGDMEWIKELIERLDTVLEENDNLYAAIRKYEPNYGVYHPGMEAAQ